MNILTIFEDPRIGGPHKQFLYFLKNKQKENFFHFYLICPGLIKNKIKNVTCLDKKLIFLSKKSLLKYIFFFIKDLLLIKNIIEKNKINIIYVAGGSSCFKSIISAALFKKKTKIIWHIHDCNSNLFVRCAFNFLKLFVDHTIFVSKKSHHYYLKNKNYKTKTILPSAVDTNFFRNRAFNKSIQFNVGMIANINPDKDIITYLNIINTVEKKNKKIKFFLIGRVWNTQKKYFSIIKKKIRILKIKNLRIINNAHSIESYLKKIDILVCTSINESLPLSICEAMSAGKPVLSTDVGDIKKFVEFKESKKKFFSGKVFSIGNYLSFSNFILELYKNFSKLKKMKANSIYVANNNFNINLYKKKLYLIFKKIHKN